MKRRYLLIFLLPLWTSCSNVELSDVTENNNVVEDFSKEFVKITPNGQSVAIKDIKSKNDNGESPSLSVNFTYDYYIEKHEVTCGEFKRLIGNKACTKDSLPVTNVTYIDAVLYANERSKADGYDTAYAYSSKECNDKNCTLLDGLTFRPNVKAYRLPTEAEWILAARQGWDTENSWNADNANFSAHPVCSKGKNSLDICDMEGNVTEWVNDWLGSTWNASATNFVGASDGGTLGERVIKGGNYHNPANAINIYSRGDVYTVTSTTTSDYLGFRLAFGEIPDALWLTNGKFSKQIATTLLANAGNIRKKTRTFKTKLAFRNDETENLVYIDYSSSNLSAIEIQDSFNVFHPDISPDGAHVAFCTSPEGVNTHSEIYVRDLDETGSNLVKLDVDNAAIPRWKVLDSGDTVIVYVSSAQSNKDLGTFMNESTWMVPFADGKFGTPQKLFDGAYHGGVDGNLAFAVTGSTQLRVRTSNGNDTVWYNSEQACNVSLSKDGSKKTSFLDFGSETGRSFVGSNYGIHEQILIVDSTGTLVQSIPAPNGYSYDHTEWVAQNLIVATLTTPNGAHEKIVLIDISDSSITELVYGEELWHPSVWAAPVMESSTAIDLDSTAIYWTQPTDPLLSSKMNIFWAISDTIEIIALGSSRVSMGFDPFAFKHASAFNMATIPSDMDVSLYLAKNYVLPHCKKLKAIVVSLDLDLWSDMPEVNVNKNILSFPGYFYDINHNFWKKEDASKIIETSKQVLSELEHLQGYLEVMGMVRYSEINSWTTGGFNPNAILADSTWSDSDTAYKIALQEFEELLQLAKNQDILVVGVVFPQSPYYAETGTFGRHGMKRSTAKEVLSNIAKLDTIYSNFIFMDENKMGYHDYPDSLVYDYDHLNMFGAQVITARIDSAIFSAESDSRK